MPRSRPYSYRVREYLWATDPQEPPTRRLIEVGSQVGMTHRDTRIKNADGGGFIGWPLDTCNGVLDFDSAKNLKIAQVCTWRSDGVNLGHVQREPDKGLSRKRK